MIADKEAREKAKLELLRLEGSQELATIRARLSAIVAEANSTDPWTSRARPSFLFVMYVLLLWALLMGFIAAFRPQLATALTTLSGRPHCRRRTTPRHARQESELGLTLLDLPSETVLRPLHARYSPA